MLLCFCWDSAVCCPVTQSSRHGIYIHNQLTHGGVLRLGMDSAALKISAYASKGWFRRRCGLAASYPPVYIWLCGVWGTCKPLLESERAGHVNGLAASHFNVTYHSRSDAPGLGQATQPQSSEGLPAPIIERLTSVGQTQQAVIVLYSFTLVVPQDVANALLYHHVCYHARLGFKVVQYAQVASGIISLLLPLYEQHSRKSSCTNWSVQLFCSDITPHKCTTYHPLSPCFAGAPAQTLCLLCSAASWRVHTVQLSCNPEHTACRVRY